MKRVDHNDRIDERLIEFYSGLEEDSWLVRLLRDPLRPPGTDGRVRLNPVVVCIAVLMILGIGTFILFSVGV